MNPTSEKPSQASDATKLEEPAADQPGPKLVEVDESRADGPGEVSRRDAWVPGLIEVVFKNAAQSGVREYFAEGGEHQKSSKAWPADLRHFLVVNDLESWKPSFPLRYKWTKGSEEQLLKDYDAAGHYKFVTFKFPDDGDTVRIAAELRETSAIEQAVAVPRIRPPSGPLDEPLMGNTDQLMNTVCGPAGCLKNQWYIFRCKVNKAWTKQNASGEGLSGKGVVIADIDWGFNRNHQDLRNKISKTRHVLPDVPNPGNVGNGGRRDHGTAVLGLAGAEVNGRGMAGVAFGSDLWAIQAGTDTIVNHELFVEGIKFVRSEPSTGRKVMILEIETIVGGNIEMILTIRDQIIAAIRDGIVVCVPAGDRGRDAGIDDAGNPIPPTGSILVGATRFSPQLNIRDFSNGGCRVVVYAPGALNADLTCHSRANDTYRNDFGATSGATPKVAGVAALMLEKNPALTHEQVRDILMRSQIPVVDNSGNRVGVLLDAEQAVCEAAQLAGTPC